MKSNLGKLAAAVVAVAGASAAQNALALASQSENVNRWWKGCVPYRMSTGVSGYDVWPSDIAFAVAQWNTINPDILYLYPADKVFTDPAEDGYRCKDAPPEGIMFEKQDYLGCASTDNSADMGYPLADYNNGERKIALTSITWTGKWWPLTKAACLHKSKPDVLRRHIIMHEIGHALGFVHEHQRADADSDTSTPPVIYRYVNAANAVTTLELKSEAINSFFLSEYDFYSIMHYTSTSAGKAGTEGTLTTLEFQNQTPTGPVPKSPEEVADIDAWQTQYAEFSPSDVAGAEFFYTAGKADMSASLSKTGGCSLTRFNNGTCEAGMQAHQLKLSATVTNHGPYDSGTTTVTFLLPTDGAGTPTVTSGQSCSPDPVVADAINCTITNMVPFTSETYEITVQLDEDSVHNYRVSVDADAEDDLTGNNSEELPLDPKT